MTMRTVKEKIRQERILQAQMEEMRKSGVVIDDNSNISSSSSKNSSSSGEEERVSGKSSVKAKTPLPSEPEPELPLLDNKIYEAFLEKNPGGIEFTIFILTVQDEKESKSTTSERSSASDNDSSRKDEDDEPAFPADDTPLTAHTFLLTPLGNLTHVSTAWTTFSTHLSTHQPKPPTYGSKTARTLLDRLKHNNITRKLSLCLRSSPTPPPLEAQYTITHLPSWTPTFAPLGAPPTRRELKYSYRATVLLDHGRVPITKVTRLTHIPVFGGRGTWRFLIPPTLPSKFPPPPLPLLFHPHRHCITSPKSPASPPRPPSTLPYLPIPDLLKRHTNLATATRKTRPRGRKYTSAFFDWPGVGDAPEVKFSRRYDMITTFLEARGHEISVMMSAAAAISATTSIKGTAETAGKIRNARSNSKNKSQSKMNTHALHLHLPELVARLLLSGIPAQRVPNILKRGEAGMVRIEMGEDDWEWWMERQREDMMSAMLRIEERRHGSGLGGKERVGRREVWVGGQGGWGGGAGVWVC